MYTKWPIRKGRLAELRFDNTVLRFDNTVQLPDFVNKKEIRFVICCSIGKLCLSDHKQSRDSEFLMLSFRLGGKLNF